MEDQWLFGIQVQVDDVSSEFSDLVRNAANYFFKLASVPFAGAPVCTGFAKENAGKFTVSFGITSLILRIYKDSL